MMQKNIHRGLMIVGLALIMAACSSDNRDLQAEIDAVKARPGGRIEPLPEVRQPPSYVYEAGTRRSPFVPDAPQRVPAASGVGPDLDRPREFLEGLPLDALNMVGTLSNAQAAYGILGADMPLEELPAAAEKAGCRAIILSGILLPKSDMVERALPALMKQCKVPVFLGGHASVKVHDSLKRLGVNVLGTDLNKGLARLRDIVPENQSGVGENAGNVSN